MSVVEKKKDLVEIRRKAEELLKSLHRDDDHLNSSIRLWRFQLLDRSHVASTEEEAHNKIFEIVASEEVAASIKKVLEKYSFIKEISEEYARIFEEYANDENVKKALIESAKTTHLVLRKLACLLSGESATNFSEEEEDIKNVYIPIPKDYAERNTERISSWINGIIFQLFFDEFGTPLHAFKEHSSKEEDDSKIFKFFKKSSKKSERSRDEIIAEWTNNIKESIEKKLEILASEKVVNAVKKVFEKKYEEDFERDVLELISLSIDKTKDKPTVDKICETIEKCFNHHGIAEVIIRKLLRITSSSDDSSEIISRIRRAFEMLERVYGEKYENLEKNKLRLVDIDGIVKLGLDKLVKDEESLYKVNFAVVAYGELWRELPRPAEDNIDNYFELVQETIKRKYGLEKDLTPRQTLILLLSHEVFRKEVINLVNSSEEKNPKYYSLSNLNINPLNYSEEELKKYAIIAIVGSRKNKEFYNKAVDVISGIVGKENLENAQYEFMKVRKEFSRKNNKDLIKIIAELYEQKKYNEVIDILKQTDNNGIISFTIDKAINYRDVNTKNDNIMVSVETNNPLDFDSIDSGVCVYLPRGGGILQYCKHNKIILIKYAISGKADETIGSAICYWDGENFLVDSVEGSKKFRKPEIFENVYIDIIERAKERNAKRVIFNTHGPLNITPREFLNYLEKTKKLKERNIEVEDDTTITPYLEARRARIADNYYETDKKMRVCGYIVELT
ncbi:MAG: hypothetical protein QXU71_03000 [Candidatus Aenigmatarchaeota archaeon]